MVEHEKVLECSTRFLIIQGKSRKKWKNEWYPDNSLIFLHSPMQLPINVDSQVLVAVDLFDYPSPWPKHQVQVVSRLPCSWLTMHDCNFADFEV